MFIKGLVCVFRIEAMHLMIVSIKHVSFKTFNVIENSHKKLSLTVENKKKQIKTKSFQLKSFHSQYYFIKTFKFPSLYLLSLK